MAKATPRRGASPRAAAKSKKVAVVTETDSDLDVVTASSIDTGLALFTTFLLVVALVLVDMIQGKNLDGILFN